MSSPSEQLHMYTFIDNQELAAQPLDFDASFVSPHARGGQYTPLFRTCFIRVSLLRRRGEILGCETDRICRTAISRDGGVVLCIGWSEKETESAAPISQGWRKGSRTTWCVGRNCRRGIQETDKQHRCPFTAPARRSACGLILW